MRGKRGNVFFLELDDDGLYNGEGDYQFDIYRMMRKETSNDWVGFYPKTNAIVIIFYVYVMSVGSLLVSQVTITWIWPHH